jgi:Zn-dependent peptidase ImmA (M78 family)
MKSSTPSPSVLASLRAVIPQRHLNFLEALRIAELQAAKLSHLISDERGILEHHIAGLPRITVVHEDLPVSGMSYWNGQEWVIALAGGDSTARQRFTLLHEFKHIIDHGSVARLYSDDKVRTVNQQAETAADYFAGCALVSKQSLKSAWGSGIQKVTDLAAHFGVSEPAIRVRLAQTGLDVDIDRVPAARCARPITSARRGPQRFRTVQPPYARGTFA